MVVEKPTSRADVPVVLSRATIVPPDEPPARRIAMAALLDANERARQPSEAGWCRALDEGSTSSGSPTRRTRSIGG